MPRELENTVTPILTLAWKAMKLYRKFLGDIASEYGLTQNEKDVLLFLHNNKALDTAGDIVKYRSISKSLVAKSVKALSARGFLRQIPDESDGRYVHLKILPPADDAVRKLREAQMAFQSAMASDLTAADRQELRRLLAIIMGTMDKYS